MSRIGLDERRTLCEIPVTLNGRPARISGYGCDFARVTGPDRLSCEFAWETVALVVSRGGRFES